MLSQLWRASTLLGEAMEEITMELTSWSSKGWYSEGNGSGLYIQNESPGAKCCLRSDYISLCRRWISFLLPELGMDWDLSLWTLFNPGSWCYCERGSAWCFEFSLLAKTGETNTKPAGTWTAEKMGNRERCLVAKSRVKNSCWENKIFLWTDGKWKGSNFPKHLYVNGHVAHKRGISLWLF